MESPSASDSVSASAPKSMPEVDAPNPPRGYTSDSPLEALWNDPDSGIGPVQFAEPKYGHLMAFQRATAREDDDVNIYLVRAVVKRVGAAGAPRPGSSFEAWKAWVEDLPTSSATALLAAAGYFANQAAEEIKKRGN